MCEQQVIKTQLTQLQHNLDCAGNNVENFQPRLTVKQSEISPIYVTSYKFMYLFRYI